MATAIRRVLVTGGSKGIGRAIVKNFAQAGHQVWFTYRTGENEARRLAEQFPGNVLPIYFDQGNWESHQKLLKDLPGPVDILVNNAALGSATVKNYAADSHLQDQALLQVNALGVLWLTQQLLPGMLQRKFGKIVLVSSVGGGISQFPGFRMADGMSKAAIGHLCKQLAAELHHAPVDVFAICPGATDTPMFAASKLDQLNPGDRQSFIEKLPKARLIDPEEIARLVVFLCGEASTILHGAVVDASMGLGVHPGLITGSSGHAEPAINIPLMLSQ